MEANISPNCKLSLSYSPTKRTGGDSVGEMIDLEQSTQLQCTRVRAILWVLFFKLHNNPILFD